MHYFGDIDFLTVVFNQFNFDLFLSLMRVLEATDFCRLPSEFLNLSSSNLHNSQGHAGPGVNFVYYGPYEGRCIDSWVALVNAAPVHPYIPVFHPIGFDLYYIEDVWVMFLHQLRMTMMTSSWTRVRKVLRDLNKVW